MMPELQSSSSAGELLLMPDHAFWHQNSASELQIRPLGGLQMTSLAYK
jgi:hypothetical protein